MYRILFFVLVFSSCGDIPSPDELERALEEYWQSRIDNTAVAGQCETPENLAVIYHDNHEFAERIEAHSGINGLNVDALLEDYPTVTRVCLNCFRTMTKCAVSNCGLGMCDPFFGYGQRSLECNECTRNACGADMIKCSGLLPDQWPDFDRGEST